MFKIDWCFLANLGSYFYLIIFIILCNTSSSYIWPLTYLRWYRFFFLKKEKKVDLSDDDWVLSTEIQNTEIRGTKFLAMWSAYTRIWGEWHFLPVGFSWLKPSRTSCLGGRTDTELTHTLAKTWMVCNCTVFANYQPNSYVLHAIAIPTIKLLLRRHRSTGSVK